MQLITGRASAAKINIYNSDGNLVYSTQSNLQKGNNQLKVSGLQGKPAGTYLVVVQTEEVLFCLNHYQISTRWLALKP